MSSWRGVVLSESLGEGANVTLVREGRSANSSTVEPKPGDHIELAVGEALRFSVIESSANHVILQRGDDQFLIVPDESSSESGRMWKLAAKRPAGNAADK